MLLRYLAMVLLGVGTYVHPKLENDQHQSPQLVRTEGSEVETLLHCLRDK